MLLDRSGSMSSRWEEAVSSINTYIHELKGTDAELKLVAFDDQSNDVLRTGDINSMKDLSAWDARPRGNTPLYDSFMRLAVEAENVNDEKTVMVVMTDGQENASKFFKFEDVRQKMVAFENKDWAVLFLGAEFNDVGKAYDNVFSEGARRSTRNMAQGTYAVNMTTLGAQTMTYASGVSGQSADSFYVDDDKDLV